jgi:hypothetical protein
VNVGCSDFQVENTIIAYNTETGVDCLGLLIAPVVRCCDIYGNGEGDWVGCIADQLGIDGNISVCPSFCLMGNWSLGLCDGSPCLPGNHPDGYDCGLIGAQGEGCICGPSDTESATWGAIKSMYR